VFVNKSEVFCDVCAESFPAGASLWSARPSTTDNMQQTDANCSDEALCDPESTEFVDFLAAHGVMDMYGYLAGPLGVRTIGCLQRMSEDLSGQMEYNLQYAGFGPGHMSKLRGIWSRLQWQDPYLQVVTDTTSAGQHMQTAQGMHLVFAAQKATKAKAHILKAQAMLAKVFSAEKSANDRAAADEAQSHIHAAINFLRMVEQAHAYDYGIAAAGATDAIRGALQWTLLTRTLNPAYAELKLAEPFAREATVLCLPRVPQHRDELVAFLRNAFGREVSGLLRYQMIYSWWNLVEEAGGSRVKRPGPHI